MAAVHITLLLAFVCVLVFPAAAAPALLLPDVPLGAARARHEEGARRGGAGGPAGGLGAALRRAVDAAVPTLFSGGVVAHWAASEKWSDPEYLSAAFERKHIPVKVSATPTFTLFAGKGAARQMKGGEERQHGYIWQDMDVAAMFDSAAPLASSGAATRPPPRYQYFTGEVPAAAADDVRLSDLAIDRIGHGSDAMSRGMLWMGSAGVTAQTHHDRSYNLFAQIVGRKAFYLLPPTQWKTLNMHPSYHGSRRQSQKKFSLRPASEEELSGAGHGRSVDERLGTNLECSLSSSEEDICQRSHTHSRDHPSNTSQQVGTGMEIFLNPGDVLYIPPFWFHTVVSLSPMTVSYSVLSPSQEEFLFADALYAQVPFGALRDDPPRTLRIAVAAYINRILRVMGEDPAPFMSLLGTTRHGLVIGAAIKKERRKRKKKKKKNGSSPAEDRQLWCHSKSRLERMKIEKRLRPGLSKAVKNVTETFGTHFSQSRGARDILLQDLFEELLVFASAQGGSVAEMIERCWMMG